MNLNKYALVMIAFVGIISVMMGTISSSYAQSNQTMITPKLDNKTSAPASTNPAKTSTNATNPAKTSTNATTGNTSSSSLAANHNAPVSNTYKTTSAQNNSTTNKAGGPLDMIKNLFKSFTGGNK